MIGMHVRYKDGRDKKEYIVVDYFSGNGNYPSEVCIIVEFPFFPDKIKQLKIWQKEDKFDIVED